MAQTKRPEPPDLERDGFILRGDKFGENHVFMKEQGDLFKPVPGRELLDLFFPTSIKHGEMRSIAKIEAGYLFSKPFFAAQLRYYGLQYPAGASKAELGKILRKAVVGGKCEKVAESIVQLVQSMKADYEPRHLAWKREALAWDDAAWARCSTMTEKAEFSAQRFLDHYFKTDGKPDPSKTKEPLTLSWYPGSRNLEISYLACDIPGLTVRERGEVPDVDLYIGWDRAAVEALADEAKTAAEWRKIAKAEKRMRDVAKEQQGVIEQIQAGEVKTDPSSITPEALQKVIGSYILRCGEIEEQWPPEKDLTLDVTAGPTPKVLQAAVDFSMIEGTMIFALSDEALDVIDDTPVDEESSEDEDEDEDEEDGDQSPNPSGKRSASPKSKPGDPKKQKADVPARRVYLRIRGRETGEGEPFSSERGYIDFTDDTYTQFKGVVDLPHVGDKQVFEGYKVDARPRRKTMSWGKFDEGWYEEEDEEDEV